MFRCTPNYLTCRQGSLPHKWRYDAPLTERSYLKHLRTELCINSPQQASSLHNQIRIKASQVFHEESEYMHDQAAQFYILICSYLLASYLVLKEAGTEESLIHDIIHTSFQKTGAFWLKWFIRIGLWLSKDKMKFLFRISGPGVSQAYGKLFTVTFSGNNQTQFSNRVSRCGFHDFFIRHQHPHLTRHMCNRDNNWASEIKPDTHKISFLRPSTIASGDDECLFQVNKLPHHS